MKHKEKIDTLIEKSKIVDLLEEKKALNLLRNIEKKLLSSMSKRTVKEKKEDDLYFATLKCANSIDENEIVFSLEKDNILFEVILSKFLQKQTTLSDYNSKDTSYIKYEVYININKNDIKYLMKDFKKEEKANNYFKKLKNEVELTDKDNILNKINSNLNKKIASLKKENANFN